MRDKANNMVPYERLLEHAVATFGNEKSAREWLNSPQRGLGGAVPIEYVQTENGAREVDNLLGRIEHGVYS